MNGSRQDMVYAHLQRAEEAHTMAGFALEAGFWNSAATELYYTCFYLIQSLFIVYEIQAHTHTGVKSLFSERFIKVHIIDERWGKLLAKLFKYRQDSNYGDYKVKQEAIFPLATEVKDFKRTVLDLIVQAGYKTNNES